MVGTRNVGGARGGRLSTRSWGQLELDGTCWFATTAFEGREVEILIGGSAEGPDERGREIVVRAITDLAGRKSEAVKYPLRGLSDKERSRGSYNFFVTGIWAGDSHQNLRSSFTLALKLEGDEFGLWRVEIGLAGPLWSGRDS